jgi:uncharacterized protein YndB with AHSA1/START domain
MSSDDHPISRDERTPTADSGPITLVARQTIRATAEQLFDAWTQPAQLKEWWGPPPVRCVDANVDLRVGGQYRIANQFPDGRLLWILGQFEVVDPPRLLVYTWRTEPVSRPAEHASRTVERVTVQFESHGDSTEVIVVHERIPDAATRDGHREGWHGCLGRLARRFEPLP